MKTSTTKLVIIASLYFVLLSNLSFFRHVLEIYPVEGKNIGFLISLPIGLTAVIVLLLSLLSSRYTTKPILILLLLTTSVATYFMDKYNIIIDITMVQNIMETNYNEASDLFNLSLLLHFLLFGVLPSVIVYKIRIEQASWKKATLIKLRDSSLCLVVFIGIVLLFSKFYAPFFRIHKPLRYYTNPTYYIYSLGRYAASFLHKENATVKPLGVNARLSPTDNGRELVILVVGEAARADRFSLNGYSRETNPLLKQEDVISMTNMHSCGTTTAYSLPCMFSIFSRSSYSDSKGAATENLLDVLQHAGIHVLWRDNNSSSKGIAKRVTYQDFRSPDVNPLCDIECRDVGMLSGLQQYIDTQSQGDIIIVLHQMGNHGPAYYKRYPPEFEKFKPVCSTNQLEECSRDEINNAYDNAILYTDYFLTQTINLLKHNSDKFKTAMLYISDHGESLGDYGIYLHGLPYALAPQEQKHVGAIFWFGNNFDIDRNALREKSDVQFSHDNLFHTILGMFNVQTTLYDKNLDITYNGTPGHG